MNKVSKCILAHRAKDCDPNIGSDPRRPQLRFKSSGARFRIPGGAAPRSTLCVQMFSTHGPRNSPRRPSAAVGPRQPSAFGRHRPAAAVGLRPLSACGRRRPSAAIGLQPSAFARRRPAASAGFRQPSACGRRRPSPAVGLRPPSAFALGFCRVSFSRNHAQKIHL